MSWFLRDARASRGSREVGWEGVVEVDRTALGVEFFTLASCRMIY